MLVQLTMPSLYDLKPRFQAWLRPVVVHLAAAGITANQVTVVTCLASVLLGAWLMATHRGWIVLPVFLFLRMAANAIDGMLAREYRQASKAGAVLNEGADLISDVALALPFVTLAGWNPPWILGAIVFATLTEFAGIAPLLRGGRRRNDGPFGKSDRAFALGFAGTWLALGWTVSSWATIAGPVVWMALCLITVGNRIRRGLS